MDLANILEVAAGVLLAFFTLRVIDFVKEAPERARQKRKAEEFGEMMHQVAHDLIGKMEEAKAAEANKPKRRRPATKKTPAKTVAKKGATNAKASTRK